MKKIYIPVFILLTGIGVILFLYLNTSSVENDILSEIDLNTVEKIAIVESNTPAGMLDELEDSEKQTIIDELKRMEVQRVNLFSANRPTDAQYVIFLETNSKEVYHVHLYNSENSVSFTSPNNDVNSSRSYRYSNSNLHETVASFF
ncbi:hypothetical protein [Planococcus sp. ISL-109]|uniref:hypothetical protein n=1 Tax=Planococcus sp. ISL-109 TaxID=2819166 RepID=UPI001BEA3CEA|nr:hypothetical protein [Planococcus sp. ISL-109]MBT2583812.1 hypothetical protein [Planococcus sp. ISL-109]